MDSIDETRWKQRLSSFGKALAQLNEACVQDSYSNLERAGLVKTFELSWKVLKDLLSHEGFVEKSPRPAIRKSLEVEYVDDHDCEILLEALEWRSILSHVYRESAAH